MAVVEEYVWVIANFKETQLGRIQPGQHVKIAIDAIRNKKFSGKVDSFQRGTGAVFSLLPPDNATGNFTKIVQRVPVKIVFDLDSITGYEDRIVPGLSTVPTINVKMPAPQKR
jgi:membrane fusion protein, multidrug efflux system